MLSAAEKTLGENVACVNRAAEDLSSKETRIAIFMAVDCFTFFTGTLGLGAMGRGRRWKVNRAAALGEEDEEGEAAIWGILRKLGA